jgi:hypothetical protein
MGRHLIGFTIDVPLKITPFGKGASGDKDHFVAFIATSNWNALPVIVACKICLTFTAGGSTVHIEPTFALTAVWDTPTGLTDTLF